MIRLHSYWRSTASYRVRIALRLKGLDHVQITHDLRTGDQHEPALRAVSPQGLVPAIELDRFRLPQSLAIMEWLEERWPEPALLPKDPDDRATVRAMAQIIACDIHPLNNLRILQTLRQELAIEEHQVQRWIGQWIMDGLSALEGMAEKHSGVYTFGDYPGLADCCLIPQLYGARRFQVDLSTYPCLVAIEQRASRLGAFRLAAPDVQPDAD